jgi:hypothetical protein
VSLQGSLDTFALPDVLVLLASTKKTGELHVVGHRVNDSGHPPQVEGRLWFNAGRMVGADGTRGTEPADVVFELLRLADGTFSFGSVTPPAGGTPVDVEPVLEEAQARLAEWREIERVVPSMAAWLSLAEDPPGAHISIRGDQWRLVATVGSGCSVDNAVVRLGLGELPGCRAVKEMVEAGLVVLAVDVVDAAAEADAGDSTELVLTDEPAAGEADTAEPSYQWTTTGEDDDSLSWTPSRPSYESVTYETPSYEGLGSFADLVADAAGTPAPEPEPELVDVAPAPALAAAPAAGDAPAVPDWRSELGDVPDLDALVSLPPRARRSTGEAEAAPAVTAESTDDPELDAEDGDEPLNRGLLLKFLSSVRN